MRNFEICPQEIYLLERYRSIEYFKVMVDVFKPMLGLAGNALDVFMSDLPYNYRHISQRPDVVWEEHVLSNF